MQAKENVGDRLRQSAVFIRKNFLSLFLQIGLTYFAIKLLFLKLPGIFFSLNEKLVENDFSFYISLGVIAIIYGLSLIFLSLLSIKCISNIYNKKKNYFLANIWFAISRLYHGLFLHLQLLFYVVILPVITLVLGMFIVSFLDFNPTLLKVGTSIAGLLVFFGWLFSQIRMTKSVLILFNGVDHDKYDKKTFEFGVSLTHNDKGRAFGNLAVCGIFIWLVLTILGPLMTIGSDGTKNFNLIPENPIENFDTFAQNLQEKSSPEFISENMGHIYPGLLIGYFLRLWMMIYIYVFVYYLYSRLKFEKEAE